MQGGAWYSGYISQVHTDASDKSGFTYDIQYADRDMEFFCGQAQHPRARSCGMRKRKASTSNGSSSPSPTPKK